MDLGRTETTLAETMLADLRARCSIIMCLLLSLQVFELGDDYHYY